MVFGGCAFPPVSLGPAGDDSRYLLLRIPESTLRGFFFLVDTRVDNFSRRSSRFNQFAFSITFTSTWTHPAPLIDTSRITTTTITTSTTITTITTITTGGHGGGGRRDPRGRPPPGRGGRRPGRGGGSESDSDWGRRKDSSFYCNSEENGLQVENTRTRSCCGYYGRDWPARARASAATRSRRRTPLQCPERLPVTQAPIINQGRGGDCTESAALGEVGWRR